MITFKEFLSESKNKFRRLRFKKGGKFQALTTNKELGIIEGDIYIVKDFDFNPNNLEIKHEITGKEIKIPANPDLVLFGSFKPVRKQGYHMPKGSNKNPMSNRVKNIFKG